MALKLNCIYYILAIGLGTTGKELALSALYAFIGTIVHFSHCLAHF
jgi:hypothetical protein